MLVTGGTNGVHAAGAAAGPEVNGSVVALGEIEPPRGEGVKSRLATVLRVLARATAEACGVDRCSIFVPRGDVLVPLMSQFADGPARPELWQMFKALETKVALEAPGIVAAVLAARRPRLIVDVPHDPRVPADWKRFGAATLLLVPLVRDDAVVGLMALDTTAPARKPARPRRHPRHRQSRLHPGDARPSAGLRDDPERRANDRVDARAAGGGSSDYPRGRPRRARRFGGRLLDDGEP